MSERDRKQQLYEEKIIEEYGKDSRIFTEDLEEVATLNEDILKNNEYNS